MYLDFILKLGRRTPQIKNDYLREKVDDLVEFQALLVELLKSTERLVNSQKQQILILSSRMENEKVDVIF